jgi:hypothetical protein
LKPQSCGASGEPEQWSPFFEDASNGTPSSSAWNWLICVPWSTTISS